MDAKLRQIISKAAGTYFIVSDNSGVSEIEAENKMRLYFINTEKGPVNTLFKFAKGDTSGFTTIFGKSNRLKEKKGNFSISTCLDALDAGPIAVINLRAFSDADLAGITAMNIHKEAPETKTVEFSKLFNTNSFWVPKEDNIIANITEQSLLNFGNVSTVNKSIFVVKSESYADLTSEGSKTLDSCSLEIDEYPALDFETLLGNTFVDVYIFNNTFNPATVNTNKYYGHLFDAEGKIDLTKLDDLAAISEAGYLTKYTGSVLPGLFSETGEEISIDTIINSSFMENGIYCSINDELFETEFAFDNNILDIFGFNFFENDVDKIAETPDTLLSYVVPTELTTSGPSVYPPVLLDDNLALDDANFMKYETDVTSEGNWFIGSFDQGIRIGDKMKAANADEKFTTVISIETIGDVAIGALEDTFQKVKYICSSNVQITTTVLDEVDHYFVTKIIPFIEESKLLPVGLVAYKPRIEQFTNGSSTRQSEILDMMNNPGIVKGIVSTPGIRYVVDCFKSFVESSYKYQFGQLLVSLDKANRFVRGIINEPFVDDLEKSTNPLFKQAPGFSLDLSYLDTGGNQNYSTKLLTKFATGADMCFFFGPGNVESKITKGLSGKISNLFYSKQLAFDVLANESGYVDNVTELEYPFDDTEREFLENFRFNPIIYFNGGNTIYGNLTGQLAQTAQQQIHNSELLAYIKENLYSLSKSEAFKKGNYDDYLRTETESKNFMEGLVLNGAIDANPIVICNASNNTSDIAKQKIKLVHIEYTPINALEKVVFDLVIN